MSEEKIRTVICEVFATRIRISSNCGIDSEKMRFGRQSRLNGRISLTDVDLTEFFHSGDEILFSISERTRDDLLFYFGDIEITSAAPRSYLEGFGIIEKIEKGSATTISTEGHGRLFTPCFTKPLNQWIKKGQRIWYRLNTEQKFKGSIYICSAKFDENFGSESIPTQNFEEKSKNSGSEPILEPNFEENSKIFRTAGANFRDGIITEVFAFRAFLTPKNFLGPKNSEFRIDQKSAIDGRLMSEIFRDEVEDLTNFLQPGDRVHFRSAPIRDLLESVTELEIVAKKTPPVEYIEDEGVVIETPDSDGHHGFIESRRNGLVFFRWYAIFPNAGNGRPIFIVFPFGTEVRFRMLTDGKTTRWDSCKTAQIVWKKAEAQIEIRSPEPAENLDANEIFRGSIVLPKNFFYPHVFHPKFGEIFLADSIANEFRGELGIESQMPIEFRIRPAPPVHRKRCYWEAFDVRRLNSKEKNQKSQQKESTFTSGAQAHGKTSAQAHDATGADASKSLSTFDEDFFNDLALVEIPDFLENSENFQILQKFDRFQKEIDRNFLNPPGSRGIWTRRPIKNESLALMKFLMDRADGPQSINLIKRCPKLVDLALNINDR